MVLVLTFILFLVFFLIVINFFAILFRLTGMTTDKAKFQVISLLTSTGYTTKESEMIVQHPTRRKIASWLMIFSYVSTATFISFIIKIISTSLVDVTSMSKSVLLIVAFIIIVYVTRKTSIYSKLEDFLEKLILKSKRWSNTYDDKLTNIIQKKGYGIYEIYIGKTNYLVGKSILESDLKNIEIQVLSIDKGDKLINFPSPDYIFSISDRITVYGNIKNIKESFKISKR